MGLLDVFKNLDLKDKPAQIWDIVDDPLKGVLEGLNRPAGATRGALASLFDNTPNNGIDNIIAGWKNPNKFQPDVQTPLPGPVNKAIDIGVQAATDPLTYLPLAGLGAKAPRLIKPLLSPIVENQTFGRTLASEVGLNAAARAGSEVGANVGQNIAGDKGANIGSVAGGLVGGGLAARKLASPETTAAKFSEEEFPTTNQYKVSFGSTGRPVNMTPTEEYLKTGVYKDAIFDTKAEAEKYLNTYYEGQWESPQQLEEFKKTFRLGVHPYDITRDYSVSPSRLVDMTNGGILSYLTDKPPDTIKYGVTNPYTKDPLRVFDTQEEAQAYLDTPINSTGTKLSDTWQVTPISYPNEEYYAPPQARPVEVKTSLNETTPVRDAIVVPFTHAYEDPALTQSHEDFAVSFGTHLMDNPEVYNDYTNWISSSAGPAGTKVRDAFTTGKPSATVMYSDGEDWKTWAASQETPFIKGRERLAFFYRGEQGQYWHELPTGERIRYNNPTGWTSTELGSPESPDIFAWMLTNNGEVPINRVEYEVNGFQLSKYVRQDTGQEIPYNDIINTKPVSTPIFLKGQPVVSMTPAIKTGSVGTFLANMNDEKWALGRWVPFDEIIGPVGGISGEHEFLVMDKSLIPDEAYKTITGVDKGAPLTQLYKLQNADNKEVLGYYNTYEEALAHGREASQRYIIVDPEGRPLNGKAASTFNSLEEAQKQLDDMHQYSLFSDFRIKPTVVDQGITITPVFRGGTQAGEGALGQTVPASLVPESLALDTQGDHLVDNIVQDTGDSTEQKPVVPTKSWAQQGVTIGGGTLTPTQFDNLINKFGYDKKVAQQLDALSAKERSDLAEVMVNNIGAQGTDAEFMKLIIEGYQKSGVQDAGKISRLNNMLRGMWATADSSWFGIQGLLTIPRLLVKGDFKDAWDVLTVPMLTLVNNKDALAKYIRRTIDTLPADAPSLREASDVGNLHLAFLKGNVDFDFRVLDKMLPFFKPDEAFVAAGDVARTSMFYNEWRRYGAGLTGEARTKAIQDIATAVNRATGIAEHPFGGQIGSFALFAPRFFQSQLETITKAFTDGSLEGTLARRQLLALVGTGTALTLVANYVRGEETILDPRDPNFMRIRNIAGNDVSVFGPWDSLAKLVVHIGMGDPGYARTKFGPLLTTAINLINKQDFLGQPIESNPYKIAQTVGQDVATQVQTGDLNPLDLGSRLDPASRNTIKSLILPFAWQEVGKENIVGGALNFFGVKNSPLSASERIDLNMQNLGLNPNDPLDRRAYIADHPEEKPLYSATDKQAQGYRNDIAARRQLNDQGVLNDSIKLVDYRENRTVLSRELMNKLSVLYEGTDFKSDTPQKRLVDSYYLLYQQAQDPITHDINSQKFDQLQAQWLGTHSAQDYEYVQRYLQIGKSDVELQYLNDMQQLDKLGYFGLKKYDNSVYQMTGQLTDDQIQNYRDQVSAARSVNSELGAMSFRNAMYELLGNQLTPDQIYGLDLAGKKSYQNIAIDDLKAQYPQLFQWFNPNATWSTYQTAKGNATAVPSYYAVPTLSQIGR